MNTLAPPRLATLFGNTSQSHRLAEIGSFIAMLRGAMPALEIAADFAAYLMGGGVDVSGMRMVGEPSSRSELVVSLGGDGTLLQALPWCGNHHIPLLGVNTGHLGYLTAYTLAEGHMLVPDLRRGALVSEPRRLLRLDPAGGTPLPADLWPYALNEVAILKADTSSMINVRADIDGIYLTDYRGDGLIISTPTGSTGYSLSVGGPLVQPTLRCTLLSPIAPHTLTMRPVVVDADASIGLDVSSRADIYRVSLDGRSFTLPAGTRLAVTPAPFLLPLVRRRDRDFADTLRSKLLWGHDSL